jgi:hypothetical protein
MDEKLQQLYELLKKNPGINVIPLVNTEVVSGDEYSSWIGSFGSSELKEFTLYALNDDLSEERMIFKEQKERIVEDLMDRHSEINEELANEIADQLDWQKVVIVHIVLP